MLHRMVQLEKVVVDLKRSLDAQDGVIFTLREESQTNAADAIHWRGRAEDFERQCVAYEAHRQAHLHIHWKIYDELIRSLENGNAKHALFLIQREATS